MSGDKNRYGPPPKLGSEAFGSDDEGGPTGSEAFGGSSPETPLRGALLFGNDPEGAPTGSDSFGGSSQEDPLRGALLFGNDPQGNPTGADAFGNAEQSFPLKGALLFGNAPDGSLSGADAFGGPDSDLPLRGAAAFGAPQLLPERLHKDRIGYDFGGVILQADEGGIAGIRKDPRDRIRQRVLRILERRLCCERSRLRHGVDESSIPWGRLRRDRSLDRHLANELRRFYRKAPGEVLGIGHVQDVLEATERMHSFALRCQWDRGPVVLSVFWRDEQVANATAALHKQHQFFIFRTPDGEVIAYVDALVPRRGEQLARVRGPKGQIHALVFLDTPGAHEQVDGEGTLFRARITDRDEKPMLMLREQRASPSLFRAELQLPGIEEAVGRIEDRLREAKYQTQIEVDVPLPRVVAWGLAAIMADLARMRRGGWPSVLPDDEEESVESVEEALGPVGKRKR